MSCTATDRPDCANRTDVAVTDGGAVSKDTEEPEAPEEHEEREEREDINGDPHKNKKGVIKKAGFRGLLFFGRRALKACCGRLHHRQNPPPLGQTWFDRAFLKKHRSLDAAHGDL